MSVVITVAGPAAEAVDALQRVGTVLDLNDISTAADPAGMRITASSPEQPYRLADITAQLDQLTAVTAPPT